MQRLLNTIKSFKRTAKVLHASFLKILFTFLYWKLIGKKVFQFNFKFNGKSFKFFADNRVDLAALDEIFFQQEYNFNYIQDPRGSYMTIIDLGANIGDTAIYYSLLFPEAKIFAVEPNPHVHEKLEMNTKQFPNIKVCKCAISDHSGKINLNFGDSHLGSSINSREQNKNSVEVDVFSLEDFCKNENIQKIDILKFDIEGAEEYLLKSLGDPRGSSLKVVQLVGEMHDDLVGAPLKSMIDSLNLKNVDVKVLNAKRYILFGTL